eukprot:7149903-Pyramimonas_sp.AAC.1
MAMASEAGDKRQPGSTPLVAWARAASSVSIQNKCVVVLPSQAAAVWPRSGALTAALSRTCCRGTLLKAFFASKAMITPRGLASVRAAI